MSLLSWGRPGANGPSRLLYIKNSPLASLVSLYRLWRASKLCIRQRTSARYVRVDDFSPSESHNCSNTIFLGLKLHFWIPLLACDLGLLTLHAELKLDITFVFNWVCYKLNRQLQRRLMNSMWISAFSVSWGYGKVKTGHKTYYDDIFGNN